MSGIGPFFSAVWRVIRPLISPIFKFLIGNGLRAIGASIIGFFSAGVGLYILITAIILIVLFGATWGIQSNRNNGTGDNFPDPDNDGILSHEPISYFKSLFWWIKPLETHLIPYKTCSIEQEIPCTKENIDDLCNCRDNCQDETTAINWQNERQFDDDHNGIGNICEGSTAIISPTIPDPTTIPNPITPTPIPEPPVVPLVSETYDQCQLILSSNQYETISDCQQDINKQVLKHYFDFDDDGFFIGIKHDFCCPISINQIDGDTREYQNRNQIITGIIYNFESEPTHILDCDDKINDDLGICPTDNQDPQYNPDLIDCTKIQYSGCSKCINPSAIEIPDDGIDNDCVGGDEMTGSGGAVAPTTSNDQDNDLISDSDDLCIDIPNGGSIGSCTIQLYKNGKFLGNVIRDITCKDDNACLDGYSFDTSNSLLISDTDPLNNIENPNRNIIKLNDYEVKKNDFKCSIYFQEFKNQDADFDGIGNICDPCPQDYIDATQTDDSDHDGICKEIFNFGKKVNKLSTPAPSSLHYASSGGQDTCVDKPNGPLLGSCISGDFGNYLQECEIDSTCGSGGVCAKNQEIQVCDGSSFGSYDLSYKDAYPPGLTGYYCDWEKFNKENEDYELDVDETQIDDDNTNGHKDFDYQERACTKPNPKNNNNKVLQCTKGGIFTPDQKYWDKPYNGMCSMYDMVCIRNPKDGDSYCVDPMFDYTIPDSTVNSFSLNSLKFKINEQIDRLWKDELKIYEKIHTEMIDSGKYKRVNYYAGTTNDHLEYPKFYVPQKSPYYCTFGVDDYLGNILDFEDSLFYDKSTKQFNADLTKITKVDEQSNYMIALLGQYTCYDNKIFQCRYYNQKPSFMEIITDSYGCNIPTYNDNGVEISNPSLLFVQKPDVLEDFWLVHTN